VTQTALIILALATPGSADLLAVVVLVTVSWTLLTGLDYGAKAWALTRTATVPFQPRRAPVAVDPVKSAGPLLPAGGRNDVHWSGTGLWWRRVAAPAGQQGGGVESSRVRS
jgi:hypothetical protein